MSKTAKGCVSDGNKPIPKKGIKIQKSIAGSNKSLRSFFLYFEVIGLRLFQQLKAYQLNSL